MNTGDKKICLVKIQMDYIERILSDIDGIKALLVDQETLGIVSLIYSQSQILKKDVYLIEKLERKNEEKQLHVKAIYLVRPTKENFSRIEHEIQHPRFLEYHLYFTNFIASNQIERFAELDTYDLIKTIKEVFCDYFVINPDFFSLNQDLTIGLSKSPSLWTNTDWHNFYRSKEGLLSFFLSIRQNPMIRYIANSEVAFKLAEHLQKDLDVFTREHQKDFDKESKTLLLITERKEDPVTPLLNQWTYQAMLHELLTIDQNRINLSSKVNKNEQPYSEFIVSSHIDSFFEKNMYCNFGDLEANVKSFIQELSQTKKSNIKIQSIEDMQKILDDYPELKKLSNNVQKHVTLTYEMATLFEHRALMQVSKAEQEISSNDGKAQQYDMILTLFDNPKVSLFDKLKLIALYAMRYESDPTILKLINILQSKFSISSNSLNLIDCILKFSNKNNRIGDLFMNKGIFKQASTIFKRAFKETENIYLQHQPYIMQLINQINSGQLKDNEYIPTNYTKQYNNPKDRPNCIIIFIIGGATYEEAKEIGLRNKQVGSKDIKNQVILGGTTIHNSKTFLAEINELQYPASSEMSISDMTPVDMKQGQKNKQGFIQLK